MFEVKIVPNSFDPYRNVLQIFIDGSLSEEFYDGGEPEDNFFNRDYAWIRGWLEEAYRTGLQDGTGADLVG